MIVLDRLIRRVRLWCADRAAKDGLAGDGARLLSELRRARGDLAGLARRASHRGG